MANNPHDPAELLAQLLALDMDTLDAAGVRSALGRNRLVESAVSTLDAALRARARARALKPPPAPSQTGPTSPQPRPTPGGLAPETLDGISGLSGPEGRRRDARSQLLERFPELGEAMGRGLRSGPCPERRLHVRHLGVAPGNVWVPEGRRPIQHEDLADEHLWRPGEVNSFCNNLTEHAVGVFQKGYLLI